MSTSVERDACDAGYVAAAAAAGDVAAAACKVTSAAAARDKRTTSVRDHSVTLRATPADCDEFCVGRSS